MFYYGTGNIFHDDHRFIECGTGHFMNHLSNGPHTAPFYHNLVLVGNIDQNPTFSRGGVGVRGPKDNEYFYVSGLTVINYFQSAVLHGCFETTCTMRYERIRWFNSTRRTFGYSGQSGIYWDMDGTLTGYTNGFVSLNYEYMHFPGICSVVDEHVNGVMCGASDGSVRVRRLLVNEQQPWQLDGKLMNVRTSAGFDQVKYDTKKLSGWPVIVLENETFDMRVDDPNDFQELAFLYSTRPYVMESLGYIYNQTTPMDESIIVHLNFTDWRDHYDADASTALASQNIGVREFELPGPGRLVQGGADAVRCFYKEPGTIIVNCARRSGTASVEMRGEVDIYWLPMTEANMEHACKCYMNEYGQTLLDALQQGKTVAVHCQEGVHRSLEFAKQLHMWAMGKRPEETGFPISMPDLPEEDEQSEQSEEQGEVEAAAVPGGQSALRLDRMPTRDDPFGSHSMMLWQDQCDEFNLTDEVSDKCGVYVNDTGLALKAWDLLQGPALRRAGDADTSYRTGLGEPTGKKRGAPDGREGPSLEAIREVIKGELSINSIALKQEISQSVNKRMGTVEEKVGKQCTSYNYTGILGGWDDDSPAAETLEKAEDMMNQLRNAADRHRHGHCLLPRSEKGICYYVIREQLRERLQHALKRVRNANIAMGKKPSGQMRFLWMQMSRGGMAQGLEVEGPTGTVWLRLLRNVGHSPGAEQVGAGWMDLNAIANSLGRPIANITEAWGELKQALR
eukprot:s5458_g6.t1